MNWTSAGHRTNEWVLAHLSDKDLAAVAHTVAEVMRDPRTLAVMFLIPIILAYTGYAYWVFRGKVDPNEGYH